MKQKSPLQISRAKRLRLWVNTILGTLGVVYIVVALSTTSDMFHEVTTILHKVTSLRFASVPTTPRFEENPQPLQAHSTARKTVAVRTTSTSSRTVSFSEAYAMPSVNSSALTTSTTPALQSSRTVQVIGGGASQGASSSYTHATSSTHSGSSSVGIAMASVNLSTIKALQSHRSQISEVGATEAPSIVSAHTLTASLPDVNPDPLPDPEEEDTPIGTPIVLMLFLLMYVLRVHPRVGRAIND